MSDEERVQSAVDHHLTDETSAADPNRQADHAAASTWVNHEDPTMPTAENVLSSVLTASGLTPATNRDAEPRDTTQTPSRRAKAAGAQIAEATNEAAETVVDTAREVKSIISESAVNAGKRLDKAESSLGPYGSPGTCVPSDLDPLAEVVHAGLDLEGGKSKNIGDDEQGRDSCAGVEATGGKNHE